GINNQGSVVGKSVACSPTSCINANAVIWGDGRIHDLGSLGVPWAQAIGVNSLGHVVGNAATTVANQQHAFMVTSGGVVKDLGTLGGNNSGAFGINRFDVAVGNAQTPDGKYQAVKFENGSVIGLGSLGDGSVAWAINASGQIVGDTQIPGSTWPHAFLYE